MREKRKIKEGGEGRDSGQCVEEKKKRKRNKTKRMVGMVEREMEKEKII